MSDILGAACWPDRPVIIVTYVLHLKSNLPWCIHTPAKKFVFFNIAQARGQDQATKRFTCVSTVMRRKYRPTLSRPIYLPTGAILVTVIVFPSVATSPVNWTFAPAFATRAAKF